MEDFVNFELAQKLKEKGFKEECLLHYTDTGNLFSNSIDTYDRPNQELDYSDFKKCFNNGNSIGFVDAPTISQVLKWLRKEKGIHVCIALGEFNDWVHDVSRIDGNVFCEAEDGFQSYESSALAGIEYVLDNLI